MNLKYDVPTPPEGAKERTVELGKMRMRTLRLSKMPLGRLIALRTNGTMRLSCSSAIFRRHTGYFSF